MNIEYCKWHSPALDQPMELKVYGFYGKPLLVFPAQGGRFYEFEDLGLLAAVTPFIDSGQIKVFAVDSIDQQSWLNWNAPAAQRAQRHAAYERYLTQEVVPYVRQHCGGGELKLIASGVDLGGCHAANAFFHHPQLFDTLICLSAMLSLRQFIADCDDPGVCANTPLHYLSRLDDPKLIEQYRNSRIIFCCGQGPWEQQVAQDAKNIVALLYDRGIPAELDLWGQDVNHEWPWWRKMLPYHLGRLNLPAWRG